MTAAQRLANKCLELNPLIMDYPTPAQVAINEIGDKANDLGVDIESVIVGDSVRCQIRGGNLFAAALLINNLDYDHQYVVIHGNPRAELYVVFSW
jgi:hypothetical protein